MRLSVAFPSVVVVALFTGCATQDVAIGMTQQCYCYGVNTFPNIATMTSFADNTTTYSIRADWGQEVIEYPSVVLSKQEQFNMTYAYTQDGSYSPYANVTDLERNLTKTVVPIACDTPWVVTGDRCSTNSMGKEPDDGDQVDAASYGMRVGSPVAFVLGALAVKLLHLLL